MFFRVLLVSFSLFRPGAARAPSNIEIEPPESLLLTILPITKTTYYMRTLDKQVLDLKN